MRMSLSAVNTPVDDHFERKYRKGWSGEKFLKIFQFCLVRFFASISCWQKGVKISGVLRSVGSFQMYGHETVNSASDCLTQNRK